MSIPGAFRPAGAARPTTYLPIEIADGIRTAARRAPQKPALALADRSLTYAQLVERITRVTNGVIHGFGIPPGGTGAILAPNCLEYIEIVCGLASAGVAAVTINARSSVAEVERVLDDSGASVLFVHPSSEEVAREAASNVQHVVVVGDPYDAWLAECSSQRTAVRIEEWDPFCLVYTSGTTGEPKGVVLSHRSRVLSFWAMGAEFGTYTPKDRTLAIAPLYHGGGLVYALAILFFGGFCEIATKFDPEEVLRSLVIQRATSVFLVPTHFESMFELDPKVLDRWRPRHLQAVMSGAAALRQVTKERIVEYFGDGLLHESYASTEAGYISNLRPEDQLRKQSCAGQPIVCTEVRLLDEDGNDVAPGEVGELHSRSPYMFNGYWQRPEATATAFHEGWLTCGDFARRDDEGYLYIVDRKHDMIVSGALNIYPREIEEIIARHPAVREVAAYGVPDDYWGEVVRAAVVVKPGRRASPEELRALCLELARYKIPKAFDFVEALPRNASGKILRRTLREQFSRQDVSSAELP